MYPNFVGLLSERDDLFHYHSLRDGDILRFSLGWNATDATSHSGLSGAGNAPRDYAPRVSLWYFRRPHDTQTALDWLRWLVASAAVRR